MMESNLNSSLTVWRNELSRIVAKLIDNYQPDLIILFGSFARDDYSAESDFDLLIVKDTDKRPI